MFHLTPFHRCRLMNGSRLSKEVFKDRRDAFFGKLADNSIAVVTSHPEQTRSHDTEFPYRQSSDVLYLSDFPEPEALLVFSTLGGKRQFVMFVRPKDRYKEKWGGRRQGVEGAKKNFGADEAYITDKFAEKMRDWLRESDRVYWHFGYNAALDAKFQSAWRSAPRQLPLYDPCEIIHEMRLFKSPEELEIMRRAAKISAEAHKAAMCATSPGVTEYQIQALLEQHFMQHGSMSPAYGSIVAGGANATILHYVENSDKLKDGDLILVDAGCELAGYASDITRCWPVNGRFTEPQRQIYELVLKAQVAAIDAARPGVRLSDLHEITSRVMCQGLIEMGLLPASAKEALEKELSKSDREREEERRQEEETRRKLALEGKEEKRAAVPTLKDLFPHGTSHWLGLDVHDVGMYKDPDGVRTDSKGGRRRILEPGMVFTVEPGLYFDEDDDRFPATYRGIGIRIEDDVVITKDGCEVLTADVPKAVEEIERLMGAARSESTKISLEHAWTTGG